MRFVMILLLGLSGYVNAHQFTPAYPVAEHSHIPGMLKIQMNLFNSREDIRFYKLDVFNSNWNPVKFATSDRVLPVEYLEHKSIDIYIREEDRAKATYICSQSMIPKTERVGTAVSSRICSKLK